MKITYARAEVEVEVDLTGGTTLPVIDHLDRDTMQVERVLLKYLSEDGRPWITHWTVSGYSAATGHTMLDLASHMRAGYKKSDTPGWLIDLVADHRPRTGDRMSLPEF